MCFFMFAVSMCDRRLLRLSRSWCQVVVVGGGGVDREGGGEETWFRRSRSEGVRLQVPILRWLH